jgi:FkbM family methyltransferase
MAELFDINNKKKVINRIGREYWIWATDKLYEQRMARENGPYQSRNLVMNRKLLPNARTVIDVGANIGMNTIEYATWCKDIKSFEPMQSSLELMKLNVDIARTAKLKGRYWDNKLKQVRHQPEHDDGWFKQADGTFASLDLVGNIDYFEYALGNQNTTIVMEQKTAECSRGDAVLAQGRNTHNPTQTAEQRTLDSFNFQDVDLIKIDVEGTELFVLQGAVDTIRRCQPVVQVELRDTHCKRFGYSCDDIINLMMSLGDYVMCDFNGNDLGTTYQKVSGVMDRFFVPRSIFTATEFKNKRVHPGMKKTVKKSKVNQTVVDNLLIVD